MTAREEYLARDNCEGCWQAFECHFWKSFSCHDEFEPRKCEEFSTTPPKPGPSILNSVEDNYVPF